MFSLKPIARIDLAFTRHPNLHGHNSSRAGWQQKQVKKLEIELNRGIENLNSLASRTSLSAAEGRDIATRVTSSMDRAKELLPALKEVNGHEQIQKVVSSRLSAMEKELSKIPDFFRTPLSDKALSMQVPVVLDQLSDDTGFGEQNCGFHALKNAFIQHDQSDSMGPLFADKELFQTFYHHYCEPLLEGRGPAHKDGSVADLRQILCAFKNDKNPPEVLKSIQRSVNEKSIPIGFFNISPVGGTLRISGGEEGLVEAEKLARFATQPGPASFIALCGNTDSAGHWYTVKLDKDSNGKMTCTICDSLNATSAKYARSMADVFVKIVDAPQKFLEESYAVLGGEIEVYSRWVEKDGAVTEGHRAQLLGVSKTCDPTIRDKVWRSYDFMVAHGWFGSVDPKKQIQVSQLDALIRFYADLPADPESGRFQKAALTIFGARPEGYRRLTLEEIAKRVPAAPAIEAPHLDKLPNVGLLDQALLDLDLALKENRVRPDKHALMKLTIEQCKEMYVCLQKIATAGSENERMKDVTDFTSRNGQEEGMFFAENSQVATRIMLEKIDTVLQAYEAAKKKRDLPKFFSCLSTGCFDGRMRDMIGYSMKVDGMDINEMADPETYLHLPSFLLSEIILDLVEDKKSGVTLKELNSEMFAKILDERYIDSLAAKCKEQESTAHGKAFLEYLELEKIVEKGKPADWKKCLTAFVYSKNFAKTFALALEQATASLVPQEG